MVEILAIIRPNMTSRTKQALLDIGHPGFTCIKAVGRGKKPVEISWPDGSIYRTNLVTKRVFSIIVPATAQDEVIEAIANINSTGNCGDGKIFVIPVVDSYRIRKEKESK